MSDLPLIITAAGPIPTPPATLRAILLASVGATNPGYTANLPGSLIEDISSTDVGAMIITDSARVEAVNSLTPFGANAFTLTQLGAIYGVPIGQASNTSVFEVFNSTAIGLLIPQGFTISDGTYQYIVQDGGAIKADGNTDPLFCLATIQGSWVVPPGTVTQIVTSVPTPLTVTVNNPESGTPGQAVGETQAAYRARLFQAGLASSMGMTRYLKTLLGNVPGVQTRLISARMGAGTWEIIVGGGDPYNIANAIFQSLFDISTLAGSVIGITAITKATHAQITTNLNHGLVVGQADVAIAGVLGMTEINGGPYTVHSVVSEKVFTLELDSTGFSNYTSGGVVTPNNRNITVSINDYPDTYLIPYVNPPQQSVTMAVLWKTDSPNLVNPAAIAQLAIPALVAYINSVAVGQPINVLEMISIFQIAINPILPTPLLSDLEFTVDINGTETDVTSGTALIAGDPESYFFALASGITVAQG